MTSSASVDITKAWRVFLLKYEAVKYYDRINLLYNSGTHRNPLLDEMLPSLLHIRAVAILDDALCQIIDRNNLVISKKKYSDDLNGRIRFLSDQGILTNGEELHNIRVRRNDLAHETDKHTSWTEIATDIDVIDATLRQHNLIGARSNLEFYAERSAARDDKDPNIVAVRDFKVGVKENGKPAIEFKWSEKLYRDSS